MCSVVSEDEVSVLLACSNGVWMLSRITIFILSGVYLLMSVFTVSSSFVFIHLTIDKKLVNSVLEALVLVHLLLSNIIS